jgi:hypothetical protein
VTRVFSKCSAGRARKEKEEAKVCQWSRERKEGEKSERETEWHYGWARGEVSERRERARERHCKRQLQRRGRESRTSLSPFAQVILCVCSAQQIVCTLLPKRSSLLFRSSISLSTLTHRHEYSLCSSSPRYPVISSLCQPMTFQLLPILTFMPYNISLLQSLPFLIPAHSYCFGY